MKKAILLTIGILFTVFVTGCIPPERTGIDKDLAIEMIETGYLSKEEFVEEMMENDTLSEKEWRRFADSLGIDFADIAYNYGVSIKDKEGMTIEGLKGALNYKGFEEKEVEKALAKMMQENMLVSINLKRKLNQFNYNNRRGV